jgi:Integrase core domain
MHLLVIASGPPPCSPWQNGHAERLIGSIRRECLDHIVVIGDAHLRRILAAYTGYCNELRTHLALAKDSPIVRSSGLARSLRGRSSADFIINTAGCGFSAGTRVNQVDNAISALRPLGLQERRQSGHPATSHSCQ